MTWTADQAQEALRRRVLRAESAEAREQRAASRRKAMETMRQRYGASHFRTELKIRMLVSPWYFDEFGNRTRTVRAE